MKTIYVAPQAEAINLVAEQCICNDSTSMNVSNPFSGSTTGGIPFDEEEW